MISKSRPVTADCYDGAAMRDLATLFVHLFAAIAKLMSRSGARAVREESLLVKHQLLILNGDRERVVGRKFDRT